MFKAVPRNPTMFKEIFQALSRLVNEGILETSPEYLAFYGITSNHLAAVKAEFPVSFFDSFVYDGSLTLSLRLSQVSKVLSRFKGKNDLKIRVYVDKFLLEKYGMYKAKFSVFENELWERPPKIKDATNIKMFEVSSELIYQGIMDISAFADEVFLIANDGKTFIQASDGKREYYLLENEIKFVSNPSSGTVLLDSLRKIASLIKRSERVTIGFGEEPIVTVRLLLENGASVYLVLSSSTKESRFSRWTKPRKLVIR